MSRLLIFFALIGLSYGGRICNAIPGEEGCSCVDSETNDIISLSDLVLNNTKVPRFEVEVPDLWKFGYQPCGVFDMFLNVTQPLPGYRGCKQSTVARYEHISVRVCDGLGNLEGSKFEFVDNVTFPIMSKLTVTYRNQSAVDKAGAVISLICDKSLTVENSEFEFVNGTKYGIKDTYYFSLRSPCACPGECGKSITTPRPATTTTPSNGTTTLEPTMPGNVTTTPKSNSTTPTSSGYWISGNANIVNVIALFVLFYVCVIYAE